MDIEATLRITPLGEREIFITRVFDAPRRLVFDAWTKPELLVRWFGGPREWVLTFCEIDLRIGGAYRFVTTRRKDGSELGWGGVYRQVIVPERLVFTERFDIPWYVGDAVVTYEFIENAGRTTFNSTIEHVSKDARDAVLKSPMAKGIAESYRRLDEFIETERAKRT